MSKSSGVKKPRKFSVEQTVRGLEVTIMNGNFSLAATRLKAIEGPMRQSIVRRLLLKNLHESDRVVFERYL